MKQLLTMLAIWGGLISHVCAEETVTKTFYRIDSTIKVEFSGEDTTGGYKQLYSYKEAGTDAVIWVRWDKNLNTWDTIDRSLHNLENLDGYDKKGYSEAWSKEGQKWYPYRRYYRNKTSEGKDYYYKSEKWDTVAQAWYGTSITETDSVTKTKVNLDWDEELNVWFNKSKYEYTYNDSGDAISYKTSQWDRESELWVNNWKDTYTVDTNGLRICALDEDWDDDNQVWVKKGLDSIFYDSLNVEVKIERWNYDIDSESFVPEYYTYRPQNRFGKDSIFERYLWNQELSDWELDTRGIYLYNDSALQIRSDYYEGPQAHINHIETFEYDERGKQIKYCYFVIEDSGDTVMTVLRQNFYGVYTKEVSVGEADSTDTNKPSDDSTDVEKPSKPNEVSISENEDVVQVYPIPTTDVLYISNDYIDAIEISTLNGFVLLRHTNTNKIDVSILSEGVYIAIITIKGRVVYRKFMKR